MKKSKNKIAQSDRVMKISIESSELKVLAFNFIPVPKEHNIIVN